MTLPRVTVLKTLFRGGRVDELNTVELLRGRLMSLRGGEVSSGLTPGRTVPRGPRDGGFGRGFCFDLVVLFTWPAAVVWAAALAVTAFVVGAVIVALAVMFVGDAVVTEGDEVAGATVLAIIEILVVGILVMVVAMVAMDVLLM